ncbi:NADH-quinone oxidoreductase subunit L [Paracoccus sp. R12_1]|uniref:NADH-quinone oxidoreductase subunit L n=1 Tax=unclassified Paracoccus (in: a-proteobacteria) TaxID=2688777 RepID=UPI001ADBE874|nr:MULTISPECIES: NADH-quinone oxidoreductase subunit L [unclassified Paracoccus (in: a-proteobacteria)]MBO9456296.1 NADH-quinone oxidoreductase subunit L [Paracoccus sp. R12_2]MBO9487412.1 NADH-quinone oxidoreductase subunit L [Paracoccus sp. R12_1]
MAQFILFAPLLGAIIAGFGWRVIGEKGAQYLTTGVLFAACFFSWIIFLGFDGETRHIPVMDWIVSGDFASEWAIRLDRLTAIMLIVVTTVSALVHLYSMGYMAHDENFTHDEHYKARFFAYLSFFTFAMLMLVTADNLLQMFFGWEGVGVASYLLIGFYYKKPSAGAAAMKAFIVNRVGDFGFLLGIFGLFWMTGSIQFDAIFGQIPELAQTQMHFLWRDWTATEVLAVLLFIGAMGKSAQLFLHTWLPDAMEGPTPVSALIHAATMVTAGVFLVCRMSPLFEFAPDAKTFVTVIGATTAFFAATVGLVQNDIKRVIAYSTCSQLGYMFVAAGVGVYSVAMFHLLTHAFFKAMLFLGAGSVIHAMHHEQDMRNYGGLRKKIPLTFWAMMIGTLAITGVGIPLTHIGFAGFLSKDAAIESAWAGNTYAFWMLVIAAAFTSFYSWRLMFMTFFGKPRGDQHTHDHAHESPRVMTVPLGVLAIGAIFAGMVWYGPFFGSHDKVAQFFHMGHGEVHASTEAGHGDEAEPEDGSAAAETEGTAEGEDGHAVAADVAAPVGGAIYMHPDNHVLDEAHHSPAWVKVSPFIAMLAGLLLAWVFYIRSPDAPRKLAEQQPALYRFLLNKWYFDEIYDFVFVRPTRWLGRKLWTGGDGAIIDGAINGVAMGIIPRLTRFAGRVQSGYLFHYAFAMVLGIVGLLIWVMMRGAH